MQNTIADNPFHHYQVRGHAVERCDATTGHAVWPIAYCDTAERATFVYTAVNSHDALVLAAKAALETPGMIRGRDALLDALRLAGEIVSQPEERKP